MLRQLAELTELQVEETKAIQPEDDRISDGGLVPVRKLLEEPFLVRLWFSIRAFFTSTSPTRLYSMHLVAMLGRNLSLMYSRYIDIRQRSYTDGMYQELVRLKRTQVFFSALLSEYENDKGGFFIILASFLIKQTCEAIARTTDPFKIPYDHVETKDVRVQLLREMESVFLSIPEDERTKMYLAAQSIEWMRNFCSIPLERMMLRFGTNGGNSGQTCLIDSIGEEMNVLVAVFASARRIPVLLLEALYLFAMKEELLENQIDLEKECQGFVTDASDHLATIRKIKSSIPLADFVRFTIQDVSWKPSVIDAGEDWFLLFKNAWKKRFDERWTEWNRLHRRSVLEKNIRDYLGAEKLPVIAERPWEGMWLPLSLRRELSLLFLKGLFSSIYPGVLMKPLKILLIEGDFYRRENLIEYTDAFSVLEHQHDVIDHFESRLTSKGDFGESFELVRREKMATVKGKVRLENLMLTVDSEVELIISHAAAAFRSMDLILGGVLGVARGGSYETLVNMSSIQGNLNEKYRKDLQHVRQLIQSADAILEETGKIEKELL